MEGEGVRSITVEPGAAPDTYTVRVREGASETLHQVRLPPTDAERLAAGAAPEALLVAAFKFLLEREPKESILPGFEIDLISHYFPEFGDKLADYL